MRWLLRSGEPLDVARLDEPYATLLRLDGLVVIDEVQRRPGLFPVLPSLINRSNRPGQYLLLGSPAPAMLLQHRGGGEL